MLHVCDSVMRRQMQVDHQPSQTGELWALWGHPTQLNQWTLGFLRWKLIEDIDVNIGPPWACTHTCTRTHTCQDFCFTGEETKKSNMKLGIGEPGPKLGSTISGASPSHLPSCLAEIKSSSVDGTSSVFPGGLSRSVASGCALSCKPVVRRGALDLRGGVSHLPHAVQYHWPAHLWSFTVSSRPQARLRCGEAGLGQYQPTALGWVVRAWDPVSTFWTW